MPDARRKAVGPKDQIIKRHFLLPSQTENKGTRSDCVDMFPAFFAAKLLKFSAQILLLYPRAKVSKDGSKGKRTKKSCNKKREKRNNSTASTLAIGQRVESRFIAVMVNHLKKTKAPAICALSTSILSFKHIPTKKTLTFHVENSFSSPYLLERFRKHFQARW